MKNGYVYYCDSQYLVLIVCMLGGQLHVSRESRAFAYNSNVDYIEMMNSFVKAFNLSPRGVDFSRVMRTRSNSPFNYAAGALVLARRSSSQDLRVSCAQIT